MMTDLGTFIRNIKLNLENYLVQVPRIPCPLSDETYHVLLSSINPLTESHVYAENLYIRVLDFVTIHQIG